MGVTRAFLTTGELSLPPDMTVDLMQVADGDNCFMLRDTWHMPPPKEGDKDRTITMELLMSGKNTAALLWKRERVQALLDHAERTLGEPGGSWTGDPVTLWLSMLDSEAFVHFDVVRGTLDDKQREYAGGNFMRWLLTLVCLPYARGPMTDLGIGFVTVSNTSPTLFIPRVPGDCDPLIQLEYHDTSPATALNGIRQGRRSLRGMQSTDFTFNVPIVAASPGVTVTDSTSLNGVNTAQIQAGTDWQTLGIARVPAGGLNALRADLRLHFKASTNFISAPTDLAGSVVIGGGTLPGDPTGYQIIVTEIDSFGNETIGSDPITIAFPGASPGAINLTWTPIGSPVAHKVYYYSPVNAPFWHYDFTLSALGSYSLAAMPAFNVRDGNPPTGNAPALIPAELRLSVALDVAAPVWSPAGPPFVAQVGSGAWEFGYGGTFRCPPLGRREGGADRGYQVRVEVRSQGTSVATISADALRVWPHDEPQCYAAEPSMDRTIPARWVVDNRRDGMPSALLTDFGTPPTDLGFVPAHGTFTGGVGGCLLLFAFEGTGGRANASMSAQVRPWITTRWLDVTGVIA